MARAFNTDGLILLERVINGDKELIMLIDRCASYARTKKDIEVINLNSFRSGEKIYAEQVSAYVLTRLLNNVT